MAKTKESVIRLMTRLAAQHKAVNLSQGFTDEAPHFELVWGGIAAELGGDDEHMEWLEELTIGQIGEKLGVGSEDLARMPLRQVLARLQNPRDRFNQYSYPFGLPELREAIAAYTERFYGFRPDPDTQITVVLGATEGLSSPLQVSRAAGKGARAIILNTPHNPTGKVFDAEDMAFLAQLCRERDLWVFTDEIYEHIVYDGRRHQCMAAVEGMAERTFVVNSISKTGSATGWRVGWVISPQEYTTRIRAIHDTMVIQAPTPLQKGTARLLNAGDGVFHDMWQGYDRKRQALMAGLRQVGFQVSPPEGSYYLFANYRNVDALKDMSPMEAAMFLIETVGVASVPGDNFYRVGDEGMNYLRFAFCRSLEQIEEGGRRLQEHLG